MRFNKNFVQAMNPLALIAVLLVSATTAVAHPMGNFSINHYAKITVDATSVQILYLLDFAEIPTYQAVREYDLHAEKRRFNSSSLFGNAGRTPENWYCSRR